MARGHPDGGQYASSNFASVMADVGEGAARLESPNTFYRTGKTIYIDDFENGLIPWTTSISGATTAAKDTNKSYIGSASIKLTFDNTQHVRQYINKSFPYVGNNKVGVEVIFFGETNNPETIDLILVVENSDAQYQAGIRLDPDNGKLYLLDENNDYIEVADYNTFVLSAGYPVVTKFVIDIANQTYDVIRINNENLDATGYPLLTLTGVLGDFMRVRIGGLNDTGQADVIYIDSFILTVDEP